MEINTAVWGTPDTWQQDTTFQNTSTMPDDYKFYRGQYPLISDYLDAKKLTIGEDIDYSMCYSAHGENMPMASLLAVATVQSEESSNHLEIVNCGASSAGWFFASSIGQASSAFNINGARIIFEDRPGSWDQISDYYWKPKGTRPVSGNAQASQRISPIVKFNPHGCYMVIRVRIINQRTGAYTVLSLADLEAAIENYQDDYVIVQAWADLYARRGVNTDTDYIPVLSNANYNTGICPNSDFVVGGIDFQKYSMFLQCGMPLFGFASGGNPSQKTFANYKDPLLHIPYVRPFYSNTASATEGYLFFTTLPYTQADPYDNSLGFCYGIWADINEDNCEQLRKCAASYGLFFTDKAGSNYANDTERWTDEDMCLGILDSDGIGHGEYTRGILNTTNPIFDWTSNTDSNYDPSKDIDPNQYADHTDLPTITDVGQYYWTDKTLGSIEAKINIGNIINAITQIAANPYNEDFIFQEPLKSVLDYRRIFLTQPWERAVSSSPIVLGKFYSNIPELPFVGYANPPRYRRVTLGSWRFYRTYGNFLDFEPYTQAFLYVPYCGVKKLPMDIFSGHTVNVYMNADNCTGELQVLIFVDNIEWGTMSGMASEELPLISEEALTASNTKRQLTYQKDMIDMKSNLGILGSLAGASISAAMHNPLGVMLQGGSALLKKVESSFEIGELNYQINHTVPDPLTIQKGNASIDKCNVRYPFVMLQTPKFINAESEGEIESLISNYGRTKGFKCCLEGTIGDFHGFTKCSNAILDGISCTYTEKTMILQALQDGVIL